MSRPPVPFDDCYIPEPNSGCWLWLRHVSDLGYGIRWSNGRLMPAHRVAYELYRGPIPEGLEPDHLCRVRCCVNPAHLELVTHQENCRRGGVHKRRVLCKYGHAIEPSPSGHRRCAICQKRRSTVHRRGKYGERAPKSPAPITFNGETLLMVEWEKKLGFRPSTLNARLKRGWTIEQALTTPLGTSL